VERFLAVFTPQLDTSAESSSSCGATATSGRVKDGRPRLRSGERLRLWVAVGFAAFLRSPFIVQEELPLLLKKAIVVLLGCIECSLMGRWIERDGERQCFWIANDGRSTRAGDNRARICVGVVASIHSQLIARRGSDQTPTTEWDADRAMGCSVLTQRLPRICA